jgi:hypothetical protein
MTGIHKLGGRIIRYSKALLSEVWATLNVFSWFAETEKFSIDQLPQARQFFDKHGWVIVSGVFSAAEVAALRAGLERSTAEELAGDVLANPHVGGEKFILNERFLQLVKTLVPGTPVHFGDASASVGFQAGLVFHKDNPDRQNGAGPDWRSPYTVSRFGLYLQNHRTHSGGLALRDYSHATPDPNKGRPFAAPTEVGDVVAWSLRTTHAGFATRLRGLVNAFLPLTVLAFLVGKDKYAPSKLLFRPLDADPRMALFATFGINDTHLHRFIRHLTTCDYAVKAWRATHYTDRIRREIAEKGIAFIDMPERTRDIDLGSLNTGYVPLPDE